MKNQIEKTNAIRIIEQKKLNYQFHDYVGTNAISGEDVAKVLNQDPNHVFKTLVTIGKSNNHYVFLVPVNMELDLKKAAIAVNEKNIEMIKSKDLLPLTGYIHGGCSPIGMKKQFTTIIDESAILYDTIMFSGGKIGYQVEMPLSSLSKIIRYQTADIVIEENVNE